MSIYATLWTLRFPRHGESHTDCEWVTVLAQGVPEHIGDKVPDPYASFLPPREGSIANGMRAVVFVTDGWPKGTPRSGQEYVAPLLVLSGTEYASIPFRALHARLCDALRGDRPRLLMEFIHPDGRSKLMFEDGSSIDRAAKPPKRRSPP